MASGEKPTVENRWWVDTGGQPNRRGFAAGRPADAPAERPIVGDRLFAVGRGIDQDRARADLTDANLKLIQQGDAPPGSWSYLNLIDEKSPRELIEKVRRQLRLPDDARGVLVDSGSTSIRAIATGTPLGERVVELRLGTESSFDAWADGEWVAERVFRNRDRALREGARLIVAYLKAHD